MDAADLSPAAPPASLLDGAALFLDFDGTLVEIAESPGGIRVPAALRTLLSRLAERLGGRVAIVSGRALADLAGHLQVPGIRLAGSHGLEIGLAGGGAAPVAVPAGLAAAHEEVARFAAGAPGLVVEAKPAGVALHFRQAPHREPAVADFLAALAVRTGLSLQRGKMVIELRPPGADKGSVVRTLMAEPPFAGARPVFVGDDLTDEHGFVAAQAMGGAGILVGRGGPSAARFRLESVAAVAAWLEAAIG